MAKPKKTLRKLRQMESFLQKELHRYDRFAERQPKAKLGDNPLLRGFRQGLSDRRDEAERSLTEVTAAIGQVKSGAADDGAETSKKGAEQQSDARDESADHPAA